MKLLVMHGPNLNLLGTREPEIYGTRTLDQINAMVVEYGTERGMEVATYQSNHEGSLIDGIQVAATEKYDAIVLNPGAYAHTSMAIADAIRSVSVPVIEVHITNVFARGPERAKSLTAAACRGVVTGFGAESYLLGIDAALRIVGARSRRAARKAKPKNPSRRGGRKKASSGRIRPPRS